MDEWKLCPFCGGDGAFSINVAEKTVSGSCWACGAKGPVVQYTELSVEDFYEAKTAWNRREGGE